MYNKVNTKYKNHCVMKEISDPDKCKQHENKIKAYIGYQGYSIFKDTLSVDEQHAIRKELMVHAHIPKSPVQPAPFPVYRESLLKLYVPRYFGMERYGSNVENKIAPGDKIGLKFTGELRDYQNVIVDKYLKAATMHTCGGGGLLDVDPGKGKTVMALKIIEHLAVKTLVVVHKSFLTNQWKERIDQFLPGARVGIIQGQVFDIENKDIVIGMVRSLSMKEYPQNAFESFGLTVFDECFPYDTCVHTSNGPQPIGKLYEIWNNNRSTNNKKEQTQIHDILSFNRETNTFEYKKITHAWKKMRGDLVKITAYERVIRCTPEHKILTVDRGYVEANTLKWGDLLLCKYEATYKDKDKDNINKIALALNEDQLQIVYGSYFGDGVFNKLGIKRYKLKWFHRTNDINHTDTDIQSKSESKSESESEWNYFQWKIDMFGIQVMRFEDERDAIYIETAAFDLDIDLKCGMYKNEKCAKILERMDERGLAVWFMDCTTVKKKKNGRIDCVHFHTHYFDYESYMKIATMFKTKFQLECTIEKCESVFQLTFDKENCIKLMDKIQKYIHEELDYNNEYYDSKYTWNNKFEIWGTIPVTSIEREKNECHYNNVYDIEVEGNHNFVIANSYCDTEKDGGIVVSNCHHMGAEVFSRCMMKLMTSYTLGLSGTMQRKDGLSKVFKMFLGDVIHKEKAESEHCVLVKGIKYVIDDDEFNEVEYDYRGNPKFSTMISKLCNYNRRSDFIVEVIVKELQHNPEQQIMILAHNKTLIQYLFKAIEHKKVATVGYYLGGMKEADLKASESKKIIIATYAMASEGLDIKTLTTLVMATPKTDVCQSVGRILRAKHTTPLVIDIIDAHDLFINQWQKRKTYYKKQNYKIIVTENGLYCSNEKNGCWLTVFVPKHKSIQSIGTNEGSEDCDSETITNVINRKQTILNGTCFL
jgi:superfamily II DNA or RNA helicase